MPCQISLPRSGSCVCHACRATLAAPSLASDRRARTAYHSIGLLDALLQTVRARLCAAQDNNTIFARRITLCVSGAAPFTGRTIRNSLRGLRCTHLLGRPYQHFVIKNSSPTLL